MLMLFFKGDSNSEFLPYSTAKVQGVLIIFKKRKAFKIKLKYLQFFLFML